MTNNSEFIWNIIWRYYGNIYVLKDMVIYEIYIGYILDIWLLMVLREVCIEKWGLFRYNIIKKNG